MPPYCSFKVIQVSVSLDMPSCFEKCHLSLFCTFCQERGNMSMLYSPGLLVPSNGVVFTVFTRKDQINAPHWSYSRRRKSNFSESSGFTSCDVFGDVFRNWPIQDKILLWQVYTSWYSRYKSSPLSSRLLLMRVPLNSKVIM